MTKEKLKIQIDKKYKFYEELAQQGAHGMILEKLENQIERMYKKYNKM